jgi:hypothetical protein
MPLQHLFESVENFAIYGLAYTVNSGSVMTEFDRLSRAGAAGRIALLEAGAQVLGARLDDCYARASRVYDKASGRSIGYNGQPEAPWSTYSLGKNLTDRDLAKMLGPRDQVAFD